jgi:CheY-like chemotaxis protein
MRTDSDRLGQVLKNLLSNAFKFTEAGEIAVRLDRVTSGWDPDHERLAQAESVIAISVADTGIGIKQELQAAMFEAFAQADGTTARQYGGTGLGLSISRNLVDLLGGEITLKSAPGEGSTFTVYLPLEPVDQAAEATVATAAVPVSRRELVAAAIPAEAAAIDDEISEAANANGTAKANGAAKPNGSLPVAVLNDNQEAPAGLPSSTAAPGTPAGHGFYEGSAAGVTVLVVDDDFRNIFALTAWLERGDLNVISAKSGMEALAVLDERTDVAIVLMDIMMPGMDGYEAMTQIRKRPGLERLPIIAVTGKVTGGERERCLAAGASEYITKPVDTRQLLTALNEWLPVDMGLEPRQ